MNVCITFPLKARAAITFHRPNQKVKLRNILEAPLSRSLGSKDQGSFSFSYANLFLSFHPNCQKIVDRLSLVKLLGFASKLLSFVVDRFLLPDVEMISCQLNK